jgi:hypothetical protein
MEKSFIKKSAFLANRAMSLSYTHHEKRIIAARGGAPRYLPSSPNGASIRPESNIYLGRLFVLNHR